MYIRLDTKLYKACHKDAVEHCSADADWKNQKNPTNSPLIFSCLYHKMIENADLVAKLSPSPLPLSHSPYPTPSLYFLHPHPSPSL